MLFLEAQLSDKIDTILKRTSTVTKDTFCSSASTSFQLTNQAIDTSGKTSKLKKSKGRHLILFVGGSCIFALQKNFVLAKVENVENWPSIPVIQNRQAVPT